MLPGNENDDLGNVRGVPPLTQPPTFNRSALIITILSALLLGVIAFNVISYAERAAEVERIERQNAVMAERIEHLNIALRTHRMIFAYLQTNKSDSLRDVKYKEFTAFIDSLRTAALDTAVVDDDTD